MAHDARGDSNRCAGGGWDRLDLRRDRRSWRGRRGLLVREDPTDPDRLNALTDDASYDRLRDRFGIRRTDPRFWDFSDRAHAAYAQAEPLSSGLFDYNRLDAR